MMSATLKTSLLIRIKSTRIDTPCFHEAQRRLRQILTGAAAGAPANCSLVGETGTGKTNALEDVMRNNPPARRPEGIERPVLFAEVPSKPSPGLLLERLLLQLGDPRPCMGSVGSKTNRFMTLVENQKVKLLFLDDFHHLVDKKTKLAIYDLADLLKELVSVLQLGMVTSGLPDALEVIRSNEQLGRRNLAPIIMSRFDWLDAASRRDFAGLLKGFRKSLPEIDMPEIEGGDMAVRIYIASGGLVGLVASLLQQVVWNAVDRGARVLRMADFATAYKESIFQVEPLPNPFGKDYRLDQDLMKKVVDAKKVAARTERPTRKGTRKAKDMLAAVGL